MLNRILRRSVICGLLPFDIFDPDRVSEDSKTAKLLRAEDLSKESGKDRLIMMYSKDEYGNLSPEFYSAVQCALFGTFTGSLIGGFINSREAYMTFVERNQATAFTSTREAQKQLQDKFTVAFGKGAFRWGWRIGLFAGSYMLISTTISVYRGKSSVMEYIAAGAITGASYRFTLGPRGILVGGVVGSALGLIGGCFTLALMKLSGTTMEDVRFWQYKWKKGYSGELRRLARERHYEETPLLRVHDEQYGRLNRSINSLDELEQKPSDKGDTLNKKS